jgi:hypothetical protein
MHQDQVDFENAQVAYLAHCEKHKLAPFQPDPKRSGTRTLYFLRDSNCCFAELELLPDGSWAVESLREEAGIRHDTLALRRLEEQLKRKEEDYQRLKYEELRRKSRQKLKVKPKAC